MIDGMGGIGRSLRGALVALLTLAAVPLVVAQPALSQAAVRVSEIAVEGNRRIPTETILLYAGIEPGSTVTPEQLNLAARNIFATGLFRDVRVDPQGNRLVIAVAENPSINRINFEGNDVLGDDALVAVITSQPGASSPAVRPRPTPSC
jgi:outer membrane protein insertion porin family